MYFEFPKERGFTLLSFLISLIVAGIVLTGAVRSLSTTTTITKRISTYVLELYPALRLALFSRQITRSLDQHRLPGLFRIHKDGLIKSSDGSLLDSLYTTRARTPDADSDAVTFIDLDPESAYEILEIEKLYSGYRFKVCNFFPHTSPVTTRSFMGIGPGYYLELKNLENPGSAGSDSCRMLLAAPIASLWADNTLEVKELQILIPIKNVTTLYRAESGTLRVLQHLGINLIENQPVSNHSPRIRWDLKPSGASPATLKLSITFSGGRILTRNDSIHLSRREPWNLIFN